RVVAAVGADHRHPRSRRVVVTERLRQLTLPEHVHLRAAPAAWKGNAEDACAPHRFDQVGRQASIASDVVGGCFDRRAQHAGVGEDGFTVDDGRGVGRHGCLRERRAALIDATPSARSWPLVSRPSRTMRALGPLSFRLRERISMRAAQGSRSPESWFTNESTLFPMPNLSPVVRQSFPGTSSFVHEVLNLLLAVARQLPSTPMPLVAALA